MNINLKLATSEAKLCKQMQFDWKEENLSLELVNQRLGDISWQEMVLNANFFLHQ